MIGSVLTVDVFINLNLQVIMALIPSYYMPEKLHILEKNAGIV